MKFGFHYLVPCDQKQFKAKLTNVLILVKKMNSRLQDASVSLYNYFMGKITQGQGQQTQLQ